MKGHTDAVFMYYFSYMSVNIIGSYDLFLKQKKMFDFGHSVYVTSHNVKLTVWSCHKRQCFAIILMLTTGLWGTFVF